MKKLLNLFLVLILNFTAIGCGNSKSISESDSNIQKELDDRNSNIIPLITRIRRLNGIAIQGGVPTVVKNQNSVRSGGTNEPLYVLDGQIIGKSFQRVDDLIQPAEIKSVKLLTGSEAAFYGTQGANGVILITSRSSQ